MRIIRYIVVHCTASTPDATAEDIKHYWKEQLGWKNPGYHYLILRDGEIVQLQDEAKIANGASGYNQISIHISYIGGIDKSGKPFDNRTTLQKHAMFDKLIELTERYPGSKILGHRDLPGVKKACPSFDVAAWLRGYEPDIPMAA